MPTSYLRNRSSAATILKAMTVAVRRALAPLGVVVCALCLCVPLARAASENIDFPPTQLTIYNKSGTEMIGHSIYRLDTADGHKVVFGENRYLDGQYDIERDEIETSQDGRPRLLTFEHTFFAADGSRKEADSANFRAGWGQCVSYKNGTPSVTRKHFDFPPDTYAGAAVMIPLQGDLRRGVTSHIEFHDFNCAPGPGIFKVRALVQPPHTWRFYPGKLVSVRIKPEFGWWDFAISMFVPEVDLWFDPAEDWHFVGARFSRYYKGEEVLLVRNHQHARGRTRLLKAAAMPSQPLAAADAATIELRP
jgi:hypothetical protein